MTRKNSNADGVQSSITPTGGRSIALVLILNSSRVAGALSKVNRSCVLKLCVINLRQYRLFTVPEMIEQNYAAQPLSSEPGSLSV